MPACFSSSAVVRVSKLRETSDGRGAGNRNIRIVQKHRRRQRGVCHIVAERVRSVIGLVSLNSAVPHNK